MLVLALFALTPAEAQRRPLPPAATWSQGQPDVSWFTEPALVAAYVATGVPMTLGSALGGDPGLGLVAAGYLLGNVAGWAVAGAPERAALGVALRGVAGGLVLWSFAGTEYDNQGLGALPILFVHATGAAILMGGVWMVDLLLLKRHADAVASGRFVVAPALVNGAPGVGARLRW